MDVLALLGKGLESLMVAGGVVRRNVPMVDDMVTVEVTGQPGASKQELYFLALAAACGTVRRFQPLLLIFSAVVLKPTVGIIHVEYDAASNWISVTLRYQYAAMNNVTEAGETLTSDAFFNNLTVYRGPQCETVGGRMDFVDPILPGIPTRGSRGEPALPWRGNVIVTNCPTVPTPLVPAITQNPPPTEPLTAPNAPRIGAPNPKPPGDNRSRGAVPVAAPTSGGSGGGGGSGGSGGTGSPSGSGKCCPKELNIVEMVFSALTAPGVAAEIMWRPPTSGPTGG